MGGLAADPRVTIAAPPPILPRALRTAFWYLGSAFSLSAWIFLAGDLVPNSRPTSGAVFATEGAQVRTLRRGDCVVDVSTARVGLLVDYMTITAECER